MISSRSVSVTSLSTSYLLDPARLFALDRLDLLDSPPEPAYDRLTNMAVRLLNVPVALMTLVDRDRQFFKSQVGLGEPWASARETPLSHSFCQYVVAQQKQLVVADARNDAVLATNLAIPDLGVIAYAGVPLRSPDGAVIGSFCAIDTQPRVWTDE
ncbi:MAG: GAF domain-containing protein, partial [Chloroflexi bacterium]|nr:GAF domain-containing protein [Chloroflexota bacterium]